jgi:hypothetical protein
VEVTQFLAEHARHLDAIEAYLLAGSELFWERNLDAGYAEPHPDFRGHLYLQGVLLARSIEEGRHGHSAEADKSLEASWVLNQSLASRHELISQLVVLSIAAAENGALRLLPSSSIRWTERLLAQNFSEALLGAFQAEAFLLTHAVEGVRGMSPFNLVTTKLSMAEYSQRVRMTAELFHDHDDPCSIDFQAVSRANEEAVPRLLARSGITDLPRVWGGVTAIRLDGEFTRLVIEARRNSGDTVHAHARPVVSAVCKSVSWIRTSSNDGRVTIAARPQRLRDEVSTRDWTFSFSPTSN